jgi:hypothetical protein
VRSACAATRDDVHHRAGAAEQHRAAHRRGPNGEAWIATAAGLVEYDGVNATVYNVGDAAGGALNNVFADPLGVLASLRLDGGALLNVDRTPPRRDPDGAAGRDRHARRGARAARRRSDSGTRGLLLAYQLDGQLRTPFAEDVTAASFPGCSTATTRSAWAKDQRSTGRGARHLELHRRRDRARPIVSSPAFNQIVRDTIEVLGSVADVRFTGYTIEIRAWARSCGTRHCLACAAGGGDTLYRWDTRSVLDGVWELRVGSSDNLGLTGYVQVTVTIDNLAPSASVTSPAKVDHVQAPRSRHSARSSSTCRRTPGRATRSS